MKTHIEILAEVTGYNVEILSEYKMPIIPPDHAISAMKECNKNLKSNYDKLKEAFIKLKDLYILEVESNPNHIISIYSFHDDWDKLGWVKLKTEG